MNEEIGILKIRIFGSHDCNECAKLRKAFSMYSIPIDFVDAMADSTQELCDKHNVEELPHTQVYREGSDKIIYEKIGYMSPVVMLSEIAEAKQQESDNPIFHGVRAPALGPHVPKKFQRGCSNCGKANIDVRPK